MGGGTSGREPTAPTIAERAAPRREPATIGRSLPSPSSVLRRAELEQARRMALAGVVFNAVGVVAAQIFGGEPTAKLLFQVSLGIGVAYNLALYWLASSEQRYRTGYLHVYFGIALFTNFGVLYYLGVFGPILVMFVLNVYAACLSFGRRVAWVALASAIAPVAGLGLAITLGSLEDPGLITPSEWVGVWGRLTIIGGFALFLLFTYLQAMSVRREMVSSLVERDAAVRAASHREALLLEARHDLERALQAGGIGRFTDQQLGSYRLGAILGRGGMGEVYEATHADTGARAAVKMVLPEMIGRPGYIRRFLREVRIAASIESEHVVRVLEVGDESAAVPYLAMERLEGEDLAQRLRREVRLPPDEALRLVREVAAGVEAAASAGIVHRDLKPHNLFLTTAGVWKILDFGVSKLVDADGALTQGEPIGTPGYMAPEQARGEDTDVRTDLYAVAAIGYRALTGLRPFGRADVKEALVKVVLEMPTRPTKLVSLPSDVDAFFAIGLAKEPADRFASPSELVAALDAALRGELAAPLLARATALLADLPWGL